VDKFQASKGWYERFNDRKKKLYKYIGISERNRYNDLKVLIEHLSNTTGYPDAKDIESKFEEIR
jgi:hypothetical protein